MEMKNIAAALVKAQKGFSPALKSSTNPHFRSKYADLSACVEAVIDSLNANGIALVQQTHECESGVMVETVFVHESGEMLSSGKLHVPASKNDAQGYGSALTYARRYSLMAACGIAPEDDDGNAASRKKESTPKDAAEKIAQANIKPASGALESLTEDMQIFIHDLSREVSSMVIDEEVGRAHDLIESHKLDPDAKVALWSKLDSKTRSSLKRHADLLKQAA